MKPIRPIFVVGMNRSGTKWLSNEISSHPDVSCVKDEAHHGILETNMFEVMGAKFDLRSPDEYIGLIELWSRTDFFRAAGVDKAFFYGLKCRPATCLELFRHLMDQYASANGTQYWLQKTSPTLALKITTSFPDAVYVTITRDVISNLRSKMKLSESTGADRSILRSAFGYALELKELKRLMKMTDHISVTYDELVNQRTETLYRIFDGLGLDPTLAGESVFEANSSFQTSDERVGVLSFADRLIIRVATAVAAITPHSVLFVLRHVRRQRVPPLVSGTFSQISSEITSTSPRERTR